MSTSRKRRSKASDATNAPSKRAPAAANGQLRIERSWWARTLRIAAFLCLGAALAYSVKQYDAPSAAPATPLRTGASSDGAASRGVRVFSVDELASHGAGVNDAEVYLAILGEVFNVTSGAMYHKAGGYDFFTGVDGSAAFVTGNFKDGLSADVRHLKPSQVVSVWEWADFYRKHETYGKIGVLADVYYDATGKRTVAWHEMKRLYDRGMREKSNEDDLRQQWPGCNMRSSQTLRTFWCADNSGGVKRGWDGYPRIFHKTGGSKDSQRCVCVDEARLDDPRLKVYEGCAPDSRKCEFQN